MKILFTNIGTKRFAVKKVLECALRRFEQPSKQLEMSLSIVGEEEIKDLNSRFRSVDSVTDVLSFPTVDLQRKAVDVSAFPQDTDPQTGRLNIGDVVICLQRAKEQAENYGHSLKREICFLSLHGLLHLLGYDHMNAEDEKQMTTLQKEILDKAGVTRD